MAFGKKVLAITDKWLPECCALTPRGADADVMDEKPMGDLSIASAVNSWLLSADPCLILLIGLPGSGKSFLAAQIQQNHPDRPIVSTDAIRAELFGNAAEQGAWSLIQQAIQQQLQQAASTIRAGRSSAAVYDATNVRRCYRRDAIATARSVGFERIIGIWLDTPLPLCLQRNQQRDRQVPEAVIRQMYRQLRGAPPQLNDGFDRLGKSSSGIPLFWLPAPNPILS